LPAAATARTRSSNLVELLRNLEEPALVILDERKPKRLRA